MKKIIFAIIVALTAAGGNLVTFALPLISRSEMETPKWFRFHNGDAADQNNYSATVSIPTSCTGGDKLCAILAEPDPDHPDKPLVNTQTDVVFHS